MSDLKKPQQKVASVSIQRWENTIDVVMLDSNGDFVKGSTVVTVDIKDLSENEILDVYYDLQVRIAMRMELVGIKLNGIHSFPDPTNLNWKDKTPEDKVVELKVDRGFNIGN
jgi:hypothetical protein